MTRPKGHKFRRIPTEVRAIRWDGKNAEYLFDWTEAGFIPPRDGKPALLFVAANNAWIPIEEGEWVLQDHHGFYPCKGNEVAPDNYEPT